MTKFDNMMFYVWIVGIGLNIIVYIFFFSSSAINTIDISLYTSIGFLSHGFAWKTCLYSANKYSIYIYFHRSAEISINMRNANAAKSVHLFEEHNLPVWLYHTQRNAKRVAFRMSIQQNCVFSFFKKLFAKT